MDDPLLRRLAINQQAYTDRILKQQQKSQPTYYQGFDATYGMPVVETAQGTTIAGRSITNGLQLPGQRVKAVGNGLRGAIDSMPRVKQEAVAEAVAIGQAYVVPILFTKLNGANREFWLGGDREPVLLKSIPSARAINRSYLSAFDDRRFVGIAWEDLQQNTSCPIVGAWAGSALPGNVSGISSSGSNCTATTTVALSGNAAAYRVQSGIFSLEAGTIVTLQISGTLEVSASTSLANLAFFDLQYYLVSTAGGGSGFITTIRRLGGENQATMMAIGVTAPSPNPLPSNSSSSTLTYTFTAQGNVSIGAGGDYFMRIDGYGNGTAPVTVTGSITYTQTFSRITTIQKIDYITIDSANEITSNTYTSPTLPTTDPDDWRSSLAVYGSPATSGDPCTDSYRSNREANFYENNFYLLDFEQEIDGETIENLLKVDSTDTIELPLAVRSATVEEDVCSIGEPEDLNADVIPIGTGTTILAAAPAPEVT